ncbi:hypothetical protein HD806DRAFT_517809 [Xylariaceae sp. AK1471]|nr:hypothetical protein HD806DRAFT_517809 [Xylariaceae sp. AK1471]
MDIIDQLVQEDAVRQELRRAQTPYDDALVEFILHRGKKLFCIALLASTRNSNIVDVMRFFDGNQFEDSKLSTEIGTASSASQQNDYSYLTKEKLDSLDRGLWTSHARRSICDAQWEVIVPIFSTERANYSFIDATILPFKNIDLDRKLRGAFSKVYKVKISPGHFVDPTCPENEWPEYFAVKQIEPPDEDERRRIDDSWANEVRTLKDMNSRHKEHIVRCSQSEKAYYMILEWADGGSLEDLFSQWPDPTLNESLIKQAVIQMSGLAAALEATHEGKIRHGDLKPGNGIHRDAYCLILRFGATDNNIFGTLKIGDWGLAKLHSMATVLRQEKGLDTTTKYGTPLYEPPEVQLGEVTLLSRQYDVWSMGCVILEIMIWLLYGYHGVKKFRVDVKGPSRDQLPCYHFKTENGEHKATLRPIVIKWLDHMANDEPRCSQDTALGALLSLVRNKMLVVQLPPGMGQTRYVKNWEVPTRRESPLEPVVDSPTPGLLVTAATNLRDNFDPRRIQAYRATSSELLELLEQEVMDDEAPLDSEWAIHDDNSFASLVLSSLQNITGLESTQPHNSSLLCLSCQKYDFFRSIGFSVEYTSHDLKTRSTSCELCALFWKTVQQQPGTIPERIRFDRVQSHLVMNNAGSPVLSICGSGGLPKLPNPGSQGHFEIMRQWLQLCNSRTQHPNCQAAAITPNCMPTRLIDVGYDGDQNVIVWEPGEGDAAEYVALSHPWGREPHFVTNVENLHRHKEGIRLIDLPATFRDAVLTTRALGKQHLWIDSICIIQGPGGDFQQQATRMETVFSSAYCVLAASRAHNQVDGFLGPRRERDYVTLHEGLDNTPFYICENIDAFDAHVLGGHLHKRGWVLQEHALARRTIFFTEHQTYWECGDGVRCETLTKMSNNLAAFLGDPKFPRIIMSASQGEKIIRFQNLYKTYSALAFTNSYDRPIAADGIQSRLLKAFGTRGGYGIFDEDSKSGQRGLLRRSLLWYRPDGVSDNMKLTRIAFPSGRGPAVVPSWSWMAYTGEIDFLKLEFGKIDWMNIQSPWSSSKGATMPLDESGSRLALTGQARIVIDYMQEEKPGKLYYDIPQEEGNDRVRCVVLGVEAGRQAVGSRLHYFILVRPARSRPSGPNQVYERVGAGYLPGRYIAKDGERIQIH